MKKAARLAAGVVASCGLMVAAPAAAHASSTSTAAHTTTVRPAYSNDCFGAVELHYTSGDWSCITTNGQHSGLWCGVNWTDNGSNWVAYHSGSYYRGGTPPWTRWYPGNICLTTVDVNT